MRATGLFAGAFGCVFAGVLAFEFAGLLAGLSSAAHTDTIEKLRKTETRAQQRKSGALLNKRTTTTSLLVKINAELPGTQLMIDWRAP